MSISGRRRSLFPLHLKTLVQQINKTSISVRISDRYLIRVYPKSNNYNVVVFWYLWNEAIATFPEFI
ncbi:hypothetical protein [Okeania sp. KiyG1]|uniref:hypothetical protein n=1 Tax=Okeania sp. KiyG1 TaxID=2720165 RepID=UPI0019248B4F|nr:hypothetical protein [Okeania sp. KiyG1]